jgi:HAD superfamily hydrolase (TIGR01548 family)
LKLPAHRQSLSPNKTIPNKPHPKLIIFDVDGVLVDVRGSFHSTTLETVRFFTGKRVTRAQLHGWKNRSGFNDDWKLSTAWVQSLGGKYEYDEVKRKFVELYWGENGEGNVAREKWLLPNASLRRMSKEADLAIFTGRTRQELDYTLDRCKSRAFFERIVTVEDVTHPKPDPEGLIKILGGRDPDTAVYVGDNVDDALASKAAGVPFIGILFGRGESRRQRGSLLRKLGASTILDNVTQLEALLKTPARVGKRSKK